MQSKFLYGTIYTNEFSSSDPCTKGNIQNLGVSCLNKWVQVNPLGTNDFIWFWPVAKQTDPRYVDGWFWTEDYQDTAGCGLDVGGQWHTTWGDMYLNEHGGNVTGAIGAGTAKAIQVNGTLSGHTLIGRWSQRSTGGNGKIRFDFADDGKSFKGKYGILDEEPNKELNGNRFS